MKTLCSLLDLFQSQRSVTVKVYDYMEELMIKFECNEQESFETCSNYFDDLDDLPYSKKLEIVKTLQEAYQLAGEKS